MPHWGVQESAQSGTQPNQHLKRDVASPTTSALSVMQVALGGNMVPFSGPCLLRSPVVQQQRWVAGGRNMREFFAGSHGVRAADAAE